MGKSKRRKKRKDASPLTFHNAFELFWHSLPEDARDEQPKASVKIRFYAGAVILRELVENILADKTNKRQRLEDINRELRAHCMHSAFPEQQPLRDWSRLITPSLLEEENDSLAFFQGAGAFWFFFTSTRVSPDQKHAIENELQSYAHSLMQKFNLPHDPEPTVRPN